MDGLWRLAAEFAEQRFDDECHCATLLLYGTALSSQVKRKSTQPLVNSTESQLQRKVTEMPSQQHLPVFRMWEGSGDSQLVNSVYFDNRQ